jgi:hypothetical protein
MAQINPMSRSMTVERRLQQAITHDPGGQISQEWARWKAIEEENMLEEEFKPYQQQYAQKFR